MCPRTKCRKCRYWRKGRGMCDYLAITGHTRGPQPPDDCTVFAPGSYAGARQPPQTCKPKAKIEPQQAYAMYAAGCTIDQIATFFDATPGATMTVLNKIGARNKTPRNHYLLYDRQTDALVFEGKANDAAAILGISCGHFYSVIRTNNNNAAYRIEKVTEAKTEEVEA